MTAKSQPVRSGKAVRKNRPRRRRLNHFEFTPCAAPTAGDRGRRFIDIAGKRFGKLTALSVAGKQGKLYKWLCKCDCGGECIWFGNILRSPGCRQLHCGCESKKLTKMYGVGASDRTLTTWREMLASGARVCARWRASFKNFRDDMGQRPRYTTIVRKRDGAGFSPTNCYWEKSGGPNGHASRIEFDGKSLTVTEWAKELGLTRQRVDQRLKKSPPEIALSYGRCRKQADSPLHLPAVEKVQATKRRGRPPRIEVPSLTREERAERRKQMRTLHESGMSAEKIALWFGVTTATVYASVAEKPTQ